MNGISFMRGLRQLHALRGQAASPGRVLGPRRGDARGFTLIETVIVVGIAIVIMVIAMPTVSKTFGMMRLQSYVADISGLVQQTRSAAVQQNSAVPLQYTSQTFQGHTYNVFYVDSNNNGSLDQGEPEVIIPNGLNLVSDGSQPVNLPTNQTGSNLTGCSATSVTAITPTAPLYFNARGLPCPYNTSTQACANLPGPSTCSVYYFEGTAPLAGPIWAAISVSPAGRVQVWNLNASVSGGSMNYFWQ
jgi:Tfp pilus assembly protein FimT